MILEEFGKFILLADVFIFVFVVYSRKISRRNLMKKVVITFGLISGVIIFGFVFLVTSLCERGVISLDRSELAGYTSMVIALSMIFFGIKSYRDNYGNGRVTFWKGVQIGLLISLIASVFYFAGGEAYTAANPGFIDRFFDKYTQQYTEKMAAEGKSQQEIDGKIKEMRDMVKMLENPFLRFAIFVMEILPVGIIITLISAAILRKKEILPAPPSPPTFNAKEAT
jgi:hypothetical protein